MARIRTIKPSFWVSAQVVECSIPARLLFIGLWTFCDDQGVHPANVKSLKMEVFPGDDMSLDDIRRLIDELSANGLITYFEADDVEYWHVTGWKHQKIEKPNNKHPNPLDYTQSPNSRRLIAEQSPTIPPRKYIGSICIEDGKGKESSGVDGVSPNGHFDAFWDTYPKHKRVARKTCADIWKRRGLDKDAEAILNGLRQWVTSGDWTKDGGKFIPHPQTFLNQNRWEDVAAAMVVAPQTHKTFAQAGEDAANYFLNQKKDQNNV